MADNVIKYVKEVTHCADCNFWGDNPVVGEDGRSWARCKKYGWVQPDDFYCKDGEASPDLETGNTKW